MARRTLVRLAVALLSVAVLAAGCTALAGIVLGAGDGDDRTVDITSYDTIDEWPGAEAFEEQFELDFPPSSRDLRLASDGFQDAIYEFRMSFDAAELSLVVDSIGCDGLLVQPASTAPDSIVAADLDWWTPDAATTFQECEGGNAPFREQRVFFDLSDGDEVVMYIQVFYF